jgi:nucleoporin NUP82
MPKILERDPAGLCSPGLGRRLFERSNQAQIPDTRYPGPLRTIAHRGTDLFTAIGNELRWSDLSVLKDDGEQLRRSHRGSKEDNPLEGEGSQPYKVFLVTPICI